MGTIILLYTDNPTKKILATVYSKLQEQDIRIIIADSDLTEEDWSTFHNCIKLPHYTNVRETVDVLNDYCSKHTVDGVLPHTEYGLLAGALAAKKFGYKAISTDAAMLCLNKWQSRNALQKQGVPVPRFALTENLDQVKRFISEDLNTSFILKPIASTLGRNVIKINRDDNIDDKVEFIKNQIKSAPDIQRLLGFS